MAKTIAEADCGVKMYIDSEDIEDFADEFEVTAQGVYCMIAAFPEDEDEEKGGFFIFCENKKFAKAVEEDFNELLEDEDFEDYFIRATVFRKGKVVFVGSEDVLNKVN